MNDDSVRRRRSGGGNHRTKAKGEENNEQHERNRNDGVAIMEEDEEETMQDALEEKATLSPSARRTYNASSGDENNGKEEEKKEKKEKIQVPIHFSCPITFRVDADPVFIASGHTYDRRSITKWFQQGHKTCPSTGQRLRNTEITPNFALRNAIVEWLKETKFLESKGEELLRNVRSQKPTVQIGGKMRFGGRFSRRRYRRRRQQRRRR